MFISRLVVRNYRNFRHLDVPIKRGVTCIVGENNTGKSNLLHALRLAVDANLSSFHRALTEEDFSSGISPVTPQQVLVSVEFQDFASRPEEEGLLLGCLVSTDTARITYRFRPKPDVREAIRRKEHDGTRLTLDDYRWEIVGGGSIDPATVNWDGDMSAKSVRFEELQQGYCVVMLEPLRDVEQRLRQIRSSPLGKLLTPADIPTAEQEALVGHLAAANNAIATSATIRKVGDDIKQAFDHSAGKAFTMDVKLGMAAPTFTDVSRGLTVLLSNHAMKDFQPCDNGLGLNNVLYISMVLKYFERRVAEAKTAGQLLIIEEPEAHLHPQLQRVLFQSLESETSQTFVTTHSTHITSQAPLNAVVVLTHDGSAATSPSVPTVSSGLTHQEIADLERFLDATRATLLFARRVMLVEGPAELFLIPALVKSVLKIDLEAEGITVIPIHGTHFSPYVKLFGENGIRKRCAVITDGDAQNEVSEESDDLDDVADNSPDSEPNECAGQDVESRTRLEIIQSLASTHVGVFACDTTFELEVTDVGTLEMFAATCAELNRPRVAKRLERLAKELPTERALDSGELEKLQKAKASVLSSAKAVGKARFAQVASKHSQLASSIPEYIKKALWFLIKP